MFVKTIAATVLAVFLAATALVSGSASTASAQYASPGPTYVPEGYYVPNGYDAPYGYVTRFSATARNTNRR